MFISYLVRSSIIFLGGLISASAFTAPVGRQPVSLRRRTKQSSFFRSNIQEEDEFNQILQSSNLDKILNFLQLHESTKPSNTQIRSIFDCIEVATAETDVNTVNKRLIEDANINAASSEGVDFRSLDRARSQMTKVYNTLRERGVLNVFGAIGRPGPYSESPIYPTSGSKIITPPILEEATNLPLKSLTPESTNFLLYGGAALATLEGAVSLYFGFDFNQLVICTLLLALMDQIIVSGAVFESTIRIVNPSMTTRVTKHEAGHFLMSYLLGCPVEGCVLSTWAALKDPRFSGRSTQVSACTAYYDNDLSEQISGAKPLTRESIDRYSIIVMGGIAAEAVEFGRADGGAGDEEALVRFLRSLNPRSGNAVSQWTPELIRNQARWGATQAVLLLKEYKPCYDSLVGALERGGDLGQCVNAIEDAARKEGLGWLRRPLGTVTGDGEFGKWIPTGEESNDVVITSFEATANSSNREPQINQGPAAIGANGVPTFGRDSITDTEEFLKMYRKQTEEKLEKIEQELSKMESKKERR